MENIFPHLYIGTQADAYLALNVFDKPGESPLLAVLDCTADLPTRKWKRVKHVTLKKVGFAEGVGMASSKLERAINFIHENRKLQRAVLVHCKDSSGRATLVCIAYLMQIKDMSYEDALKKLETVCGKIELDEKAVESVKKFITKQKPVQDPGTVKVEVKQELVGG